MTQSRYYQDKSRYYRDKKSIICGVCIQPKPPQWFPGLRLPYQLHALIVMFRGLCVGN